MMVCAKEKEKPWKLNKLKQLRQRETAAEASKKEKKKKWRMSGDRQVHYHRLMRNCAACSFDRGSCASAAAAASIRSDRNSHSSGKHTH